MSEGEEPEFLLQLHYLGTVNLIVHISKKPCHKNKLLGE